MGQNNGKHGKHRKTGTFANDFSSSDSEEEVDKPHSGDRKPASVKKKNTNTAKSSKGNMPFFRRPSEKSKRRLEHQQYLAKVNPEPTYDVSNCELTEVPSGVFAQCRVFHKEALLLNDNFLESVEGGGKMSDLKMLRVMDLHNNELKSLPDGIGEMESLQVLNLENNKLKKLPNSMNQLQCLQTLNLKGNRLKSLPDTVCGLKCLRFLDLSSNEITELPKQLCQVRTLETLVIDCDNMQFPSHDICIKGTEDIMKYLCSECGQEYLPPSNFLLDVLDAPKYTPIGSTNKQFVNALREEENIVKSLENYSALMDRKRQERVELERQLLVDQRDQDMLAAMASQRKQRFLNAMVMEESQLDKDLEELAHKKAEERNKLLVNLSEVERGTEELIHRMLDINEKARKTEELLEVMEQERIQNDEWFVVRWEEVMNLRRKEVLDNMEKILDEAEGFETLRQIYERTKGGILKRALDEEEEASQGQVDAILDIKNADMKVMLDILSKQEEIQKEAFEALQLQKDARNLRISNQISLIEEELAQLTVVELERKELRAEEGINILCEKRIALIELLTQLLEEREIRQVELKKRLEEMEQQRLDGQSDYWLVQFQRLMDRKPQALIDQERNLELSVIKILEDSGAEDYIPLFARHRISIETLLQMSDNELKQMGVHEAGLRKNILRNAEAYCVELERRAREKAQALERDDDLDLVDKKLKKTMSVFKEAGAVSIPEPSAPPMEPSPTRQHSVLARGVNSECCVCLERESEVIFLNCGHVCCCMICSDCVTLCPLCRAGIVQRIKLTIHSALL